MSNVNKDSTVSLQAQLKIAKQALKAIRHGQNLGGYSNPEHIAAEALDRMWPLEKAQQIQGLVGHIKAGEESKYD